MLISAKPEPRDIKADTTSKMGHVTVEKLPGQDGDPELNKLQQTVDIKAGEQVLWVHVAQQVHGRTIIQPQVAVHLPDQGQDGGHKIYF